MADIVVALDGSPLSETVLPHARLVGAGGPVTLVTTRWDHDVSSAREYLEQRAAELGAGSVETVVIVDREPADAILVTARRHPGSIICMATHGRSGLGEEILGSVAEAVVRSAEPPVLLVGPDVAPAPGTGSRVLVAVDSAWTARALVPTAVALAASLAHGLAVVEVASPPPVPFAPDADVPALAGEDEGIKEAATLLASYDVGSETRVLRDGDPARAIVELARDLPASYVVVGTHARHGFARIALGSVAMRVVRHCRCPVLVVRAGGAAGLTDSV